MFDFEVKIAQDKKEIRQALGLRYQIFKREPAADPSQFFLIYGYRQENFSILGNVYLYRHRPDDKITLLVLNKVIAQDYPLFNKN